MFIRRLTSQFIQLFRKSKTSDKILNLEKKMEITRNNFAEKLPVIEEAIKDASFIAIDGEFTGLHDDTSKQSSLDTPAERYAKSRNSVRKFLLVQFGMVTFHYDAKTDQFTNRAFNFYVWPRPFSRSAPDPRFGCQTSSIDFLVSQNFDFNKLFRDGISYLRPSDENRIRDRIKDNQQNRKNNMTPGGGNMNGGGFVVPEDQRDFAESTSKKVQNWLEDPDARAPLILESCNAFQRRIVYSTVKPKFSEDHSFHMETIMPKDKTIRDRSIMLSKVTASDEEKIQAERDLAEFAEVDEAVGFCKVIHKISESKKIVVGHNMFLDILYTLQQFVAPLPEDYDEFKELMKASLPNIIDTKLMANTPPLKEDIIGSTLEELVKIMDQGPFKLPKLANGLDHPGYSLESTDKYHEAGYDAFITGLCFISMSNRLAKLTQNVDQDNVWPNDKYLSPFINKVNMFRIIDVPYLNLAGPDHIPDRDHVFHVTFPAEWKTPDLVQLFFPFGGVQVFWESDSTAYVSLREHVKNAKSVVMSTLNCSSIYKIAPYEIHKKTEMVYESLNQSGFSNTSGITPMLEMATPFKIDTPKASVKRAASPEQEVFKRTKSVTEEPKIVAPSQPKLFGDQSWD